MDKLAQIHLDAAFKILKYLKNTPKQGLFMSVHSESKLTAYYDSDWASYIETRKSLMGFYIFLRNSLIS